MSQRKISTAFVYTPSGPAAKQAAPGGRPPRGRPSRAGRALAVLLAVSPASAGAEEHIRVLASAEPRKVVELRLEDYVAGVVAGEMPESFPAEAQKAQAVAARSYALTRKIEAQAAGREWDIRNGVLAQVFAHRPGPAARAAAEATAGEVLSVGVEPVEAYFHASCGGGTEGGLAALGRDLPYLAPVRCGRCDGAPGARWTVRVSAAELGAAAGLRGGAASARVASWSETGRVDRVEIHGAGGRVTIAGTDLRQRLGYSRLPSLAFELREERGGFALVGRGRGHGAGLCQWGAAGLARDGMGYREILLRYYPGTQITRMY